MTWRSSCSPSDAWTVNDDGALVRRGDDPTTEPEKRWPGVAPKLTMHLDPGGLMLRVDDLEMRLISQLALARAGGL